VVTPPASRNFGFLHHHDPRLPFLGAEAEQLFAKHPVQSLVALRAFGEVLAQRVAARSGLPVDARTTQKELIDELARRGLLLQAPRALFHELRIHGNEAAHGYVGDHREALHRLKQARELAVWFQRAFGNDRRFDPGPFVPPPGPEDSPDDELRERLAELEAALAKSKVDLRAVQRAVDEEAAKRLTAEQRAQQAAEERALWEALAEDAGKSVDAALAKVNAEHAYEHELRRVQREVLAASPEVAQAIVNQVVEAGEHVYLDETATRRLIDAQLREAGWEVSSEHLTEAGGARPEDGHDRAIAEWRVGGTSGVPSGRADYVLFVGRTAMAIVEAKRKGKDVSALVSQAERYSRAFAPKHGAVLSEGAPWGGTVTGTSPGADALHVPFLFATNGRPYLAQIAEKSGIWFRDGRRAENHARALAGWFTPADLVALAKQDVGAANAKLAKEDTSYLNLREYQVRAIRAVEEGLAQADAAASSSDARRAFLVAMATGTGKTRTAIGLVYRLLKTKRFRRILFLVDRRALGEQTENAFQDAKLENLQTFTEIFDVNRMADQELGSKTRLQIATVQGMAKRILSAGAGAGAPSVGAFDCVIVDECHRGYGLDREMSDSELEFRDFADYVSTFRRVLDHFDAVKIGLTATPALHTIAIFGEPIFRYTYREAVIDGCLIDHEPPTRIVTRLAEDGIRWEAGSEVQVLDGTTHQLDLIHLPDEVDVELDGFNTRVLTENFNRVVCTELARHIDPGLPGKTLIFAATDAHADTLVRLLTEAFEAAYGPIHDKTVVKITGAADKPDELIRRFKNERLPSVAVTVDLLTTGIDVPEITNIVFVRRVKSRILYEQMLGRATRLCPKIDKEVFRIFDAVDLYAALEDYTEMLPVAAAPTIPFAQLVKELVELPDAAHQKTALEQLIARLQRKKHRLKGDALARFEATAEMSPAELLAQLKSGTVAEAAAFFAGHAHLVRTLDESTGGGRGLLVSNHDDELRRTEHGYGSGKKPDDYLAGFSAFLRDNVNALPALLVVTQRPRELTRKQLREIELALSNAGYTETKLRTAWQDKTNANVAATIIGFIRQAALGDPLVNYDERVDHALRTILKRQAWTAPQRDWLTKIGKQMKKEKIVDRAALDADAFASQGGFKRIDKLFDGTIEQVLGDLHDAIWNWKDAG
jgi:type I restriction enzyme, R subunit